MYIFLLIPLFVLCASNYYLAHRITRCIQIVFHGFPFAISISVLAFLTVMMLLSVIRPFGGIIQKGISLIGVYWMGIFVYLLLFFLSADFILLIIRLSHLLSADAMHTARLATGIVAMVLTVIVSAYGFLNACRIKTVEYNVSLAEKASSNLTIALISDVHLGAVGSEARLEKAVTAINKLEPDIVCIAGDFFDTDYNSIDNPENAIDTVKKIKSTYGIYACLGNHDAGKTLSLMEDFYDKAGVKLLKDNYVTIEDKLILAGRLDFSPIGGAGSLKRGELSQILNGADPSLPVVVMDHNPKDVDTYSENTLILSGHTHKGQIFPGSLITNAIYTVDYGFYRSKTGAQAIVTSGTGLWGLPMRVGTNCEVVKINLSF